MDEIDLMCSGYEWFCPDCDMPNHAIEITKEVTCEKCGHTFKTGTAEHAYE